MIEGFPLFVVHTDGRYWGRGLGPEGADLYLVYKDPLGWVVNKMTKTIVESPYARSDSGSQPQGPVKG